LRENENDKKAILQKLFQDTTAIWSKSMMGNDSSIMRRKIFHSLTKKMAFSTRELSKQFYMIKIK